MSEKHGTLGTYRAPEHFEGSERRGRAEQEQAVGVPGVLHTTAEKAAAEKLHCGTGIEAEGCGTDWGLLGYPLPDKRDPVLEIKPMSGETN